MALKKVQIVFPSASTQLLSWTVTAVLDVTDFKGTGWHQPVDADTAVVIFIADRNPERLPLQPIRKAIRDGLTVFVITGVEGTVSPYDLGVTAGKEKIYFFHAGTQNTAQEGFLPFNLLGTALQRILKGKSLESLGKE